MFSSQSLLAFFQNINIEHLIAGRQFWVAPSKKTIIKSNNVFFYLNNYVKNIMWKIKMGGTYVLFCLR